ncbi:MAG: hypothetical protein Q7S42_00385 [Candidatus Omnitrophota bacterium]|nr:hypothetical protein [Candidatus Omnitrophota bacterium]
MNEITALVFRAIDEVNSLLPKDRRINKDAHTILSGTGATLDSLSLVNLVVAVEQEIEKSLGKSIILADERAMKLENNPFRTIESLVTYICEVVT